MWTRALVKTQRARLKAQKKKDSQGKSVLSKKELTSGSGESTAVHFVQSDLTNFSDGTGESDDDPAVVRTVEILSAAEGDVSAKVQEKDTRSSRGIPSR